MVLKFDCIIKLQLDVRETILAINPWHKNYLSYEIIKCWHLKITSRELGLKFNIRLMGIRIQYGEGTDDFQKECLENSEMERKFVERYVNAKERLELG